MEVLDNQKELQDEKNVSPMPIIIRYGLILGALAILQILLQFTTGAMFTVGIVSMIVSIVGLVWAVKAHRNDDLGGQISLGRAFQVAFGAGAISSVIGAIFNYIYVTVINPNAVEQIKQQTEDMMLRMGTPEDVVNQAMEKSAADFDKMATMSGLVSGVGMGLVMIAVISLIIALIMKRSRPIFE